MPTAKRRREISDDGDAQEPNTPRFGAGEDDLSHTVYVPSHRRSNVWNQAADNLSTM